MLRFLILSLTVFSFIYGSDIKLVSPQRKGGKPLMQVLNERKTSRTFDSKELSAQHLSNLMWAAFGINREETGGRTAPSARNMQEIDVYVTLKSGLFLYEAKTHTLKKIHDKDIRTLTGNQPFVKDAPMNLVFVADYTRVKGGKSDDARHYAGMDAAYISQNVYLFSASAGLATVARGSVDRDALAKEMNLLPTQEIILAQSVGYQAIQK